MSRTDAERGRRRSLRGALVAAGRRLDGRRLIAGADGNLSARLDHRHLLVTPSGVAKGALAPNDLVVVDRAGQIVGSGRPSSELGMHLAVYRHRPDVLAAIHAHPPFTIAASLQPEIHFDFAPEAVAGLAGVARLDYARPGTPAVATGLEPFLGDANTFIMTRHGALTLGTSVEQALVRMESLEHCSLIALLALAAGHLDPLEDAELRALRAPSGSSGSSPSPANPVRGGSARPISDEEGLVMALCTGRVSIPRERD